VRGKTNKTLFIKKASSDIILVQVYVDHIIFRSTNENLCKQFVTTMQGEFEMSMMGELNYFLGLQIKQFQHGTFLSQLISLSLFFNDLYYLLSHTLLIVHHSWLIIHSAGIILWSLELFLFLFS